MSRPYDDDDDDDFAGIEEITNDEDFVAHRPPLLAFHHHHFPTAAAAAASHLLQEEEQDEDDDDEEEEDADDDDDDQQLRGVAKSLKAACDVCGKITRKTDLADHRKTHFPPDFFCAPCAFSTYTQKCLNRHFTTQKHLRAVAAAAALHQPQPQSAKRPRPSPPSAAAAASSLPSRIAHEQTQLEQINAEIGGLRAELAEREARHKQSFTRLLSLAEQRAVSHECTARCRREFELQPCGHTCCEADSKQVATCKRCSSCGSLVTRINRRL